MRGIPVHSLPGTLLVLLGTFSPAIVAVSRTAQSEGSAGVRELFGRIVRHPAAARWFLFAISYFAVIKLSAAVIHRLGWGVWPRFGTEPLVLLPFALAISTPVQAGEELGWRGYALPRMADRIGLAPASLLLGMIWAVWHLPLFFVRGADTFHQSFPAYAAGTTGISVAIAWLYTNGRGGLLLPMLLHAAVNNTKDIVPSAVPVAPGVFSIHASRIAWISASVLWACTIPMLVWMVRTERERTTRER